MVLGSIARLAAIVSLFVPGNGRVYESRYIGCFSCNRLFSRFGRFLSEGKVLFALFEGNRDRVTIDYLGILGFPCGVGRIGYWNFMERVDGERMGCCSVLWKYP